MTQPFDRIAINDFGCPSVGAIRDRMFQTYPVVSIEVAFGFYKDQPMYEYWIKGKDSIQIHNIIKDRLTDIKKQVWKVCLAIYRFKDFGVRSQRS